MSHRETDRRIQMASDGGRTGRRAAEALRRRAGLAARAAVRAMPPQAREVLLALAAGDRPGPAVVPGPPSGPVLVVAPHPDDEVIGPGGAIARHVDAGHAVTVLILTSGGATAAGGRAVERAREAESLRACRHLGLRMAPTFARLPDADLAAHREQMAALIGRHGAAAATIYVPNLLDPHPDHVAAALAVADADLGADVWGYDVWTPAPATSLLDVSGVFARKQAALREYRIALRTVDYVRAATGLAAYRSAAGGMGGRGYAEGFLRLDAAAHARLAQAVAACR